MKKINLEKCKELLAFGVKKTAIALHFGVSRPALYTFLKKHNLQASGPAPGPSASSTSISAKQKGKPQLKLSPKLTEKVFVTAVVLGVSPDELLAEAVIILHKKAMERGRPSSTEGEGWPDADLVYA